MLICCYPEVVEPTTNQIRLHKTATRMTGRWSHTGLMRGDRDC
jgi:hypothetical protein